MKMRFTPIDYNYFDFQGRNYIRIVGRNEKNQRICLVDSCQVYLWAVLKDNLKQDKINSLIKKIEKIQLDKKGRNTKVEKVELKDKNFHGKKVQALKVYATNYKDLPDVASEMGMEEIEKRRGHDLGYITHYIMESGIRPLEEYEIEGELLDNTQEYGGIGIGLEVDHVIKLNSSKELKETKFKPKVLAFDIETDAFKIGEGNILMVSMVTDNFKKVITWKKSNKKPDYVEYVEDEAELLEKFTEYVKELSPDIITGYYSDGFDLPYLKSRAEHNGVKLALGLDGSQVKFSRGANLTAKVDGIVHIDILRFIRNAYSQYMQSETLSLNEVSKEILGDTKKEYEFKDPSKMTKEEWNTFYEYCLHDSVLTHQLFEKFWPDLSEFAKIMQEPIFNVSRNAMASNVEDYIIHKLNDYNEIPEKRPGFTESGERRSKGKYEGAFVFEPIAGLYENIAMYDFTSSYGSVIVTYNLSGSTLLEKPDKNAYSVETGGETLYFSKVPGFLPEMLREIIEKRKEYKKELGKNPNPVTKARSNAFKLLANAYYGYQGFFGARYYCREAAAATAAFAKQSIKEVIDKIDKHGFKTIYSDTDSIAFLLNKHSQADAKKFLKELNADLPGIMELELEGFFKRGLWVTKRSGTAGAKKKYALLDENDKIKIRGFETVRRDWCPLARKLQSKILTQLLKDGNETKSLEMLKKTVKDLKERKVELKELIIKTRLKKPIEEYKAITPHVIAARKMKEEGISISEGTVIEYYLADIQNGKKLVRDKVKLPSEKGEYEIKYYLENQIIPAVDNIFQVFGVKMKELVDGKKQTTLLDF